MDGYDYESYIRKRMASKHGNELILGEPGTGKTALVKKEIADILNNTEDEIFVIDPNAEYINWMGIPNKEVFRFFCPSNIPADLADADTELYDSTQDTEYKKRLNVFDISGIANNAQCTAAFTCLDYIVSRMKKKHKNGRQTWTILEGGGLYTSTGSDISRLNSIWKYARKSGGRFTIALNSVEELINNNDGLDILVGTPFAVILPVFNENEQKFIQNAYDIPLSMWTERFKPAFRGRGIFFDGKHVNSFSF